jgi:enoyl-CoA hydratase/carnithine racemase
VRAAKRLLGEVEDLPVAAALALETEVQRGLLGTRNQLEAVTAAMQKRAPVFEDR